MATDRKERDDIMPAKRMLGIIAFLLFVAIAVSCVSSKNRTEPGRLEFIKVFEPVKERVSKKLIEKKVPDFGDPFEFIPFT